MPGELIVHARGMAEPEEALTFLTTKRAVPGSCLMKIMAFPQKKEHIRTDGQE